MYRERPSTIAHAVVWSSTVEADQEHRVLPDGCLDLLWSGGRLMVAGPDTVAYLASWRAGTPFVGLRFGAGVGPRVLGLPAHELRDQRVPLDAIWPGAEVRRLAERLAEAAAAADAGRVTDIGGAAADTAGPTDTAGPASATGAAGPASATSAAGATSATGAAGPAGAASAAGATSAAGPTGATESAGAASLASAAGTAGTADTTGHGTLLDAWHRVGDPPLPDPGALLEAVAALRLGEAAPADPAVERVAWRLGQGATVGAVAREVGLSARQLHRRSLDAFGYGPKTLSRILRLHRALELGRSGTSAADAAYAAGYADQAHLSREARSLTGVTLTTLVA